MAKDVEPRAHQVIERAGGRTPTNGRLRAGLRAAKRYARMSTDVVAPKKSSSLLDDLLANNSGSTLRSPVFRPP